MDEKIGLFDWHREYTFLHSGAHRKPAARIGAPGLCRQVNFWMPSAIRLEAKRGEEYSRSARSKWISHVDEFIGGLIARVTDPAVDPGFSDDPAGTRLRERSYNVSAESPDRLYLFRHTVGREDGEWTLRPIFRVDTRTNQLRPDCQCEHHLGLTFRPGLDFSKGNMPARYENFSLAFFWRNVWVKFRFVRHSEYFSMGIYIDLSGTDRLHNPSPLMRDGAEDDTLKADIVNAFRAINEICGKRYQDIIYDNTGEGRSASDRSALEAAHDRLYESIWKQFDDEIIGPALTQCSKRLGWGDIGSVVYDGRIVLLHLPHGDPKPKIERLDMHGSPQILGTTVDFLSPPQFDYARLGRLADRIALDEALDPNTALTYADTMQPFISAPTKRIDSRIEYTANLLLGARVVYMTSLSAEYTGPATTESPAKALLVCKLNHSWQLGRLVDRLFVLGSTRVAALMNLEALIGAGEKLQSMSAELEREGRLDRRWTPEDLRAMETVAADVRQRTAALGLECDGGIDYRIERSRYYVQQFTEVENTLRLDMIEGFQKYSYFVRHRYFSTYGHIDRLGVRLNRHRQALTLLAERMRYRSDRLLQEKLIELQEGLTRLQVAAESLLMIPLIYYGGHVLEQLLAILGFAPKVDKRLYDLIWIVPIVLVPAVMIPRVRRHLGKIKAKRETRPSRSDGYAGDGGSPPD